MSAVPPISAPGKQDPYVVWTAQTATGDPLTTAKSTIVTGGGVNPEWPTTDVSRLLFQWRVGTVLRLRVDVLEEDKGMTDAFIGAGFIDVTADAVAASKATAAGTTLSA